MKIFEKAPAKINLSLDVLHKRSDGYHEVEMVMTMVDLADRIEMQELSRDTIIISSQAGYIPLDEKNLAFQAARLIKDRYDVKQGVYIHLDKQIPVAAGLAGGSSDAAATLRGLNRLWNLNIPMEDLQVLGAELGSDVPFCVTGGTAVARGRGEKLEPIVSPPQCWVVLAKPPINVSTSEIYGKLNAREIKHHPSTEGVLSAIREKQIRSALRKPRQCAGGSDLGPLSRGETSQRMHAEAWCRWCIDVRKRADCIRSCFQGSEGAADL